MSVEFSRVLTLAELHDNHARINRTVRNEYIESRGNTVRGDAAPTGASTRTSRARATATTSASRKGC